MRGGPGGGGAAIASASSASLSALKPDSGVLLVRGVTLFLLSSGLLTGGVRGAWPACRPHGPGRGTAWTKGIDGVSLLGPSGRCGGRATAHQSHGFQCNSLQNGSAPDDSGSECGGIACIASRLRLGAAGRAPTAGGRAGRHSGATASSGTAAKSAESSYSICMVERPRPAPCVTECQQFG